MIVQLYAVFDRGARSYGSPMVFANDEICVRGCTDLVRAGGDAPMILYPADFDVYHIGSYDLDAGILVGVDVPRLVVRFADVAAKLEA